MIWQLIKLEPMWKCIPMLAVFYAILGWFVADSSFFVNTLASIMIFVTVFMQPGFRRRYTVLEATLPIAGKTLFLSRVVPSLAFVWVPLLAAVVASVAGKGNRGLTENLAMIECGVAATVGLMWAHSVRAGMISPPKWIVIPIIAAGCFLPGLMGGGALPGSVGVIVTVLGGGALASVALFLKGWVQVPKSLQLAPAQPVSTRSGWRGAVLDSSGGAHRTLYAPWWAVFRALYFRRQKIAIWFLAIEGVLWFSVNSGTPLTDPLLGLLTIYPFALMLFAGYSSEWRWLLPLPISARKLLWLAWSATASAILVGVLAAAIAGYATSNPAAVRLGHARSMMSSSNVDEPGTLNVQVPGGYWRWARGGTAPVIEAPWGENYRPQTEQWLSLAFYNPYSVGRESSQRFLEWQFLRATEAAYGQPISLSQAGSLPRMKTIEQQAKARIVILAVALLYCLVQMCTVHLAGGKRLLYKRSGLRFLIVVAPPLLAIVFTVLLQASQGGDFSFDALVLNLTRVLPDNLWMLTLTASAAIAGLYWLAEKLWCETEFSQIEGPFRFREAPGAQS
jgi:hypothetical protein